MDFDDLDTYKGAAIHNMYVDSDYEINTCTQLPGVFTANFEESVENINDWN